MIMRLNVNWLNRGAGCAAALVLACASAASAASKDAAKSSSATKPTEKPASLALHAGDATAAKLIHLKGSDARQQLLATAKFATGAERDYTRAVTYTAAPANIVAVDKEGLVTPVADGKAIITAKSKDGVSATIEVTVENAKVVNAINFANQIVPIFTKAGCNSGGCHGKASGQNGFKLSLLGFEPTEDFEHLVKEARGRRLFPPAPEQSLLLVKGAAVVPHGGGKRIDVGSYDYELIKRWIAQGMPYGDLKDPTVARIEVFPKERTMARDGEQQLVVLATYTDGHVEDVTRGSLYEANDKDIAATENTGRVTMTGQTGDLAVMVRYQGKVATFVATVPLGEKVENLPVAKNFIDELTFKKLVKVGMPPSPVCDDATFLRRATLDIAGRTPTSAEVEKFLADKSADKRDKWIDQLLDSSDYADYFANKWAALLRNKRVQPTHTRGTYAFYNWIRDSFVMNKPYDVFVREILAASGDIGENPPVAWYRQVNNMTTQLEDTAQLFLGTRLQCAQCHHHPYEKWSQQDYYSFGAFFSQVSRKPSAQPGEEIIFAKRSVPTSQNKKNSQTVKPAGLGAPPLDIIPDDDARHALADWMSAKDNRFFAHSLVNRYWKHFFNRGLVEPEDDMRETNPATNPELLDALAKSLIESGFDMKALVRAITRSTTYQLSAIPNDFNKADKHYYSRYYPKRLTAEVLFDAINVVTKSEPSWAGLPTGTRAVQLPDNSYNASSYFLTVFGRPDSSSSCECERSQDASLAQSLHLLNSKDIQSKLAADTGRAAVLATDEKRTDDDKLRELYQWAYARNPESYEAELAKQHIEKILKKEADAAKKPAAKRQAYEDIVWALVSSKEFLFNH
jgi:hypothetical protein